MLLHKNNKNC